MFLSRFALAWVCLAGTAAFPALADPLSSAFASAGSETCSQFGSSSANCQVTAPAGSQLAAASAAATATWALDGSGILEATARGFGSNTSGTADVSYSHGLAVTGVSGAGYLQIDFTGFQMELLNSFDGASVSPLTVKVGSYTASATLPSNAPQGFTAVTPITFGSPTSFTVAFGAVASGTFSHNGSFAANDADGLLQFPAFVVTDSSGKVLTGTSVEFVPEPASWLFVGLGLCAVMLGLARKQRA